MSSEKCSRKAGISISEYIQTHRWDLLVFAGNAEAALRNTRGLTRSVMALIVPLAGAVASLEQDHDPQALVLHPLLEGAQFGLKPVQLLLVWLAPERGFAVVVLSFAIVIPS